MSLKDALAQLDPAVEGHWTTDGLPRIEVVRSFAGDDSITRATITQFAPELNKASAPDIPAPGDQPINGGDDGGHGTDEPARGPVEQVTEPEALKTDVDVDDEADIGNDESGGSAIASEPGEPAPVEARATPDEDKSDEPDIVLGAEVQTEPEAPKSELDVLVERRTGKEADMIAAQKAAETAKQKADDLANQVNALNRRIEVLERQDHGHQSRATRDYLAQSKRNRESRANQLKAFMRGTGLGPDDLQTAMDPRAPIDKALGVRKPGRGSARPAAPHRPAVR